MAYKCIYFGIKELVSPTVYKKFGENSWMFFSENILMDLDYIRESWQYPIIINNWSSGGNLKQCGLRSNMDEIPFSKTKTSQLYLSAHTMGRGFDLHDKLGRNQKLFAHVYDLINNNQLKTFKRLENWQATSSNGGWVHIDDFQRLTLNNIIF